ncbi:MAG: hypothetical protein Q4F41_16880 [Eubacteriales bacterium]|nr:hypothetical protein [Eubacteriales bacterium]
MSTFWNVLLIILFVVVVVLAILYFVGRKLQKKQAIQQEQMEAAKQTVTMLVIDKKMMKIKDAGLPAMVVEQTPKLMRRTKLPIVKAKVGPRVMTLVCDAKVYDLIPLKKTVKAVVSGIYITEVKGIRGPLEAPPKKKKQGFFSRFRKKNKDEKPAKEKK